MFLFRLSKRQDRNVEVLVEVCDQSGRRANLDIDQRLGINPGTKNQSDQMPNDISKKEMISNRSLYIIEGVGIPYKDFHTSLVFYHEPKPKWNEVIKISIPVEKFTSSHIRFTYFHRSRGDSKSEVSRE